MKAIRVFFRALEPLILSNGTTEGMAHKCLDHIPGNMLLGACAERWKQINPGIYPDDNPEFRAIFLEGGVLFGHALPDCGGHPACPTPLCLIYVKQEGKLPTLESDVVKHPQVFNTLIPREEKKDQKKTKRLSQPFLDPISCHVPDIPHIHAMHVAIDREKRQAKDRMLFGYEAVSAGASFCTTIVFHDPLEATVHALFDPAQPIRIGHSRSAGYGTAEITSVQEATIAPSIPVTPGTHCLFFESAFFPEHSWESPRDGLLAILRRHLGNVLLDQKRVSSKSIRMEGFNSIWRLPRQTRFGFAEGSVFVFTAEEGGSLPPVLGKWQNEGYGRIVLDMPLLQKATITPEQKGCRRTQDKTGADVPQSQMLSVWRSRAATRKAKEEALALVWQAPLFDGFIESVKTENRPSLNQRGNLRNLVTNKPAKEWIRHFSDTLDKQPGRQWKTVRAKDPFTGQRGNLDDIMLKLLTPEEIPHLIQTNTLPLLPGGPLTGKEKDQFLAELHRRLLLELLRRWEKATRLRA
ncbi:MAG: hypothetical protein IJU76_04135 [Desulfovibrionaceae bacterium]|nr:hypothetical protein [Desulfovibrionaceae bacterium]